MHGTDPTGLTPESRIDCYYKCTVNMNSLSSQGSEDWSGNNSMRQRGLIALVSHWLLIQLCGLKTSDQKVQCKNGKSKKVFVLERVGIFFKVMGVLVVSSALIS